MKILVGSKNPVKINAVKDALSLYYDNIEVSGFDVNSEVSVQPIGEETFLGAKNRALKLFNLNIENNLSANLFIGIEGGIINLFEKWFSFGCMCIIDENKNCGFGLSPLFELPNKIVEELLSGKELGTVMDEIQNLQNTKQNFGAISYFTNGVMNRKELYIEGLKVAIIPFLKKELFFK